MNQDQLLGLKKRIINDIVPLALNSDNSADRFELLLRVIQAGGASGEVYSKAYESAKQIQDRDQQLDSLLALLDEIDLDSQIVDEGRSEASEVTQPEPRPEDNQNQPQA